MHDIFQQYAHANTAVIYQDKPYSYEWLFEKINYLVDYFEQRFSSGSIVQLNSDFSPLSIAVFFALASHRCIVSPITNRSLNENRSHAALIQAEVMINISQNNNIHNNLEIITAEKQSGHELVQKLRAIRHAGLIILSSGSSGKYKAIIHDLYNYLNYYYLHAIKKNKKSHKTLAFLLFDHIGGLNALFQNLFNNNIIVIPDKRTVLEVCKTIEVHRVSALVTSPSFLNLLLVSELYTHYDLSSLEIINYGSEPMPDFLLKKLNTVFASVRFCQSYGTSESGVLNVHSQSSDSLFIKIKSSDMAFRIRKGLLEIKSPLSMLGYINANSPFTPDGWIQTGDKVEQQGEFLKILGRASDIINIGGQKVYPAEIENIFFELEEIEDVVVIGEPNILLGNIIKAKIKIRAQHDFFQVRSKLQAHCRARLPAFKVPQKIEQMADFSHNHRFKKMRVY